jgi:uncharacterized protein (DUF2141 family)
MQIQSFRTIAFLILTSVTSLISGCGDAQGDEVGKDPNIPVSLKPKNPEANSPETPQPGVPGSIDGNNGSETPNTGTTPPNNPQNPIPVVGTPPPPAAPQGITLTVAVSGIRTVRGNVCLSLFNSPNGFPDSADSAILAECFTAVGGSFDIKIDQVPPGKYAIALWHDENRDGKMNYNFLGIPKEGLAFSENGRPRISPPPGPPSFDSIAFEVKNEARSTPAKMTYLLDFL